jgi:hypothetical protein
MVYVYTSTTWSSTVEDSGTVWLIDKMTQIVCPVSSLASEIRIFIKNLFL